MTTLSQTSRPLAVGEAAIYTGLASSTLNKLRHFGGGPAFLKLGRRVLYDLADLDVWLAAHRRHSTADKGGDGE